MIDRHELLATLKPLVIQLEQSIRERALATPEVAAHLKQEHHKAVVAERTAMSLEEWRDGEITQAAVAWVLGCVFVRFLEDNALIDQALISGPGGRRAAALGYREEYFRAHPEHSDREYLEACFRAVCAFPAVASLYDERHNPLWRLGPTADGARALRETFTAIHPASGALVHDFADPELDTRFLGDLYQDLSEAAKSRYALLQTPEFVERFILDRTLDPAIDGFGVEEVRLIDPTCGSGHFLIGAFDRMFTLWQDREPGTARAVLAQKCLDRIAGVDLNPYATAIARFRLTMTALKACRISRLAEAPAFTLHLATGDSLLHGPLPSDGAAMLFDSNRLNQNIAHVFETEDAAELKTILGRGYHAVVGNPPYIAVRDRALRDAYRARYTSCHGKYVLTVPFMERFFELGRISGPDGKTQAGFVGKITGNSFMKREFGVPLVNKFLPSVDLQILIDASGAYIPGHGTPTALLFGRSRKPVASTLRVVDGIRGEPDQPADPAHGLVWMSIISQVDRPGHEDRFTRSSDIDRRDLLTHPLSLGIGRPLSRRLESGATRVGALAESVGVMAFTLEDDLYVIPARVVQRRRIEAARMVIEGPGVRDWHAGASDAVLFPYDSELSPIPEDRLAGWYRFMWPWRACLERNVMFGGKSKVAAGLKWYEFGRLTKNKFRSELSIGVALVATTNHFALDRSGNVLKHSAPVIKFPVGTSLEEHLRVLGVLNSSAVGFWLKQVCHNKGDSTDSAGARVSGIDGWIDTFEYNATNVADIPLPSHRSSELPRILDAAALERARILDPLVTDNDTTLVDELARLQARDEQLDRELIALQEELDWEVLTAYGLVPSGDYVYGAGAPPIALGQRAFEIVLARQLAAREIETTWFARHGSRPLTEVPADWPDEYRAVVARRIELIESDADVGLIERPEHKRRWNGPSWEERRSEALSNLVLDAVDDQRLWGDLQPRSTNELTDVLRRDPRLVEALELLTDRKDDDIATTVRRLIVDAAVPGVAAARLTEKGMTKLAIWERVWDLQRAEDRGEKVDAIPVPPRYAQGDFRNAVYWRHRGKLDVPKERFILIPNAEHGADPSPVVGWAGWNERDLARALAGRIVELREEEAAEGERVTPLLAGVLELLPWIYQWHPDPDPLYGGSPGEYFENWLDGQLAELSITHDNLRAWRPPAPARGRKARAGAA